MMTRLQQASSTGSRQGAAFQSTLWTQIRVAGRLHTADARRALEALCAVYWQPIYAFLRRCGQERQDAKDLTQGFFAYLLEENLFQKANPDRGRFRSFLLGSLKFFVGNEQARERALKRGGGIRFVTPDNSGWGADEPFTHLTPERLFDRKWALAVLAQAMDRLAGEYRRAGMREQFVLLQPHLTGDADERLPGLAAQLGKSDGATRVLLFRLRNRFRKLVRAVIADTVCDLNQVENELQHLQTALRDD